MALVKLYESGNKKFLTEIPEENSAVCWNTSVSFFSEKKVKEGEEYAEHEDAYVNASLRIQDCTRSVNIEFDAYDKEDIENQFDMRIKKIDTLIKELNNFRESLETSYLKAKEHNIQKKNKDDEIGVLRRKS